MRIEVVGNEEREQWPGAKVSALISAGMLAVNDGYRVRNVELGEVGIPFVRGGDIGDNGEINTDVADHVLPQFKERLNGKFAAPGDVAFISKGTVGRVGRIRDGQPRIVFAPQVCFWRSRNPNVICPTFLFYIMTSEIFQSQLDAVRTHGSMVADYVSLADQRSFTLPLPPIEVQREISSLLGSLDNKIEQNRRTGRKLEELARAVFKAWFVDFEPVKAKAAGATSFPGMPPTTFAALPTRLVDSELDPVPEGWKVGTMGDVGTQRREQLLPEDIDSETPYIGLEHMPGRDVSLGDWGTAASVTSSKFRFRRDDILFGKLRPYFHKVGLAAIDGVCSTDIVVLYPKKPEYAAWLLMLVSSDEFVAHTDRSSAGTKMPRTNWKDMAAFRMTVPPAIVAPAFQDKIGPMLDMIVASIHESRKLAALRDYLLPRLLSGRVRVSRGAVA